ncbi:F-box only protein 15 isoform X5 [Alligator mississippiensis]|uniref:F-box only protein 15 isoform X5 n=1 Tax=Alligator mississippiensis TaxID=8496 RepID=UPI002877CD68|nr:F-box only protein 15 isoform X5 [Alligator mississippiensis]
MAMGRGWVLRQHWAGAGSDMRASKRSGTFTAVPLKMPGTQNVHIQRQCHKSSAASTSCLCIESMPSEILLKILSYLDAVTLLCIGCVNRRFYNLANDNVIWFKKYSNSFPCKILNWKTESIETTTVSLSHATVQERKLGYWKKEYIMKHKAVTKTGIIQLLRPINLYTGLPLKTKEAIKASNLSWVVILKDRKGKEHVVEQVDITFNDTSVTVYWYGTSWPCLDTLSTLELCGMTPLLLNRCKVPTKNGKGMRLLLLWQVFIITKLLRKAHWALPLSDMSCLLINLYWMMLTQSMDCMATNYTLTCTVVGVLICVLHFAICSAEKNCYMMDITVLDETEKPFWCFSAPVYMKLSSKTSGLYDYMGHIYDINYVDSDGKVHIELVWMDNAKEYYIVNLILYISTKKVNSWYGTNYRY